MSAGTLVPGRPGSAPSPVPSTGPLPWELSDLLRVATVNGVAVLAVLVAWSGTSGTALLSKAVTWTVVGIGALILQGCGNVGWLLRGRRAVGQRRARLLRDMDQLPELAALSAAPPTWTALPPGAIPTQPRAGQGSLLAVEGATRYHLPGCQLVQGKRASAASAHQHQAASRVPCGVCQP